MKLFKKDYEAIAIIIKNNDTIHLEDITRNFQGINLIKDLIKYFKKNNPKFDEKRFKEACGW